MIFRFGRKSRDNLNTVHTMLRAVMEMALEMELIDISIVEGYRDEKKQNEYFNEDPPRTKVEWPNSKHNSIPSEALDAAPYVNGEVSWKKEHCIFLAGVILACARIYEVKIRWGGNWDMDVEPVTDQDFQDLVHYELV